MATSIDLLRLSLLQIDQQIADLTTRIRPDYSLDGEGPALSAHLAMLLEKREKLREAITLEEGPTEIHVQGMTW